ncbi:MAG: CHAT domain-containing protein [Acidobacteria bacterium]|nr:CHAT domain-containing protein [Acidobacteriota bacterium]
MNFFKRLSTRFLKRPPRTESVSHIDQQLAQARQLFAQSEFLAAKEHLKEALAAGLDTHQRHQVTPALVLLGQCYLQLKVYPKAVISFEHALKNLTSDEPTLQLLVLNDLALAQSQCLQFDAALSLFEQAIRLALEREQFDVLPSLAYNVCLSLTTLNRTINKLSDSTLPFAHLKHWLKALSELVEWLEPSPLSAWLAEIIGTVFFQLGQFDLALSAYEQAQSILSLHELIGDESHQRARRRLIRNLATVFAAVGKTEVAAVLLEQVKSWSAEDTSLPAHEFHLPPVNPPSIDVVRDLPTLHQLPPGFISLTHEQAVSGVFLSTFPFHTQDSGKLRWQARGLEFRAELLADNATTSGEVRSARDLLLRALLYWQKLDDPIRQAQCFYRMSRLDSRLGDVQTAIQQLEQALVLAQTTHETEWELRIRSKLVELLATSQHIDQTQPHVQLIESRLPCRQPELDALCRFRLGKAAAATGNRERAQICFEQAIQIIESQRQHIEPENLRSAYLGERISYYTALVELLLQPLSTEGGTVLASNQIRAAFEVCERSRARLLRDLMSFGHGQAHSENQNRVLHTPEAANPQEVTLEPDSIDPNSHSPDLELSITQFHRQQSRRNLRRQNWFELSIFPNGVAAAIQAQLEPDSALVEFFFTDTCFAWVVTQTEICAVSIPNGGELETLVSEWFEQITRRTHTSPTPHRNEYRKQLAAADQKGHHLSQVLGERLLGPLWSHLQSKTRWYIVSDGPLHYLPFTALTVPGSFGRTYAVEWAEIISLPSAAAFGLLRELKTESGLKPEHKTSLLVVSDPVFQTHDIRVKKRFRALAKSPSEKLPAPMAKTNPFERLVYAAAEPHFFEAILLEESKKPCSLKLLTGFDASLPKLQSLDLKRFDFLHFSTHGMVNTRHPELSAMALSFISENLEPQNGYFDLFQLHQIQLDAHLITLTGCQTAHGTALRGEGIVGLVHGFLSAGAKRVVASVWLVDDEQSLAFTQQFYRLLLVEEQSVSTALRNTQLSFLKNSHAPETQSPYYWAAFQLFGLA